MRTSPASIDHLEHKGETLVEVNNLVKYFPVRAGLLQRVVNQVKAVDDVSFSVKKGETLGMVGESGCGKTTVGRTMLRLIEPTSGAVKFDGRDVFSMKAQELKIVRRDMQIIFQDPYASLDPRVPIGESVMEGLHIHKIGTAKERVRLCWRPLKKWALRIIMPAAIRMNFQVVNASVLVLRERWPCAQDSSFAMNPSLRWTYPFNPRF